MARRYLGYEKVIFVPSKMRYITDDQGKSFAFDDAARLRMLEKISEKREWMEVCDYEINSPEQPRTYRTLCFLRDQGYAAKLLFGSDKLCELETGWRHIPELCREFGIAVLSRSHDNAALIIQNDPYLSSLKEYFTVIPTPDDYQDISSTNVRNEIIRMREAGKAIRQMVPEELGDMYEYAMKGI